MMELAQSIWEEDEADGGFEGLFAKEKPMGLEAVAWHKPGAAAVVKPIPGKEETSGAHEGQALREAMRVAEERIAQSVNALEKRLSLMEERLAPPDECEGIEVTHKPRLKTWASRLFRKPGTD